MNIQLETREFDLTEKSKKIEDGWTIGKSQEIQLWFNFFETSNDNMSNSDETNRHS